MTVLPLLCSSILFLSLIFITFIYLGGGVHVYQRMYVSGGRRATQANWFSSSTLCSWE